MFLFIEICYNYSIVMNDGITTFTLAVRISFMCTLFYSIYLNRTFEFIMPQDHYLAAMT